MAVLVIAHRGARSEAPENTLAAFQLAVEAGADMIEFDVQLTQDGQAVIMHDPTVDRMTDMRGRIADLTWDELSKARVGGAQWPEFAERIPLLHEVLALSQQGGIAVNIELKPSGDDYRPLADTVIDVVRRTHFPVEAVLISCFNVNVLEYIERTYPQYPLATVYKVRPENPLSLPGRVIHPEFSTVDPSFIQAAQAAGKRVNVWTLNRPEQWEKAIGMNVDGITTDEPRLLRLMLRDREAMDAAAP